MCTTSPGKEPLLWAADQEDRDLGDQEEHSESQDEAPLA
jgi:hypothetical protein